MRNAPLDPHIRATPHATHNSVAGESQDMSGTTLETA